MTDDHEHSDQTKPRIPARSASALGVLAITGMTAFTRARLSARGTSSTLGLLGWSLLAAVAIALIGHRYYGTVDRRIANAETDGPFAGRANIYIDQILAAPEVSGAARSARAGWIRLLTQGQGVMEGTLRLDGDSIRWDPARLAGWLRMEEWAVPIDQVGSVSVKRTLLGIGKGGVATLHLRSGSPVDLLLPDRERFAAAWTLATRPGRPGAAR